MTEASTTEDPVMEVDVDQNDVELEEAPMNKEKDVEISEL